MSTGKFLKCGKSVTPSRMRIRPKGSATVSFSLTDGQNWCNSVMSQTGGLRQNLSRQASLLFFGKNPYFAPFESQFARFQEVAEYFVPSSLSNKPTSSKLVDFA